MGAIGDALRVTWRLHDHLKAKPAKFTATSEREYLTFRSPKFQISPSPRRDENELFLKQNRYKDLQI